MKKRKSVPVAKTRAWLQQAITHHQNQRVSEALALYKKVLAAEPDNIHALNFSGMAHIQSDNAEKAVSVLKKAIAVKPDFADAYQNLAVALKTLGQLSEAVAIYQHLIELRPTSAEAHNDLGIALRKLGKYDDAINVYQQALSIKPKDAKLHANLGNALLDQDKPEQACASFRQALSLNPKLASVHHSLGLALQQNKQLDEAISSYQHALKLNPKHLRAALDLGRTLVEQGDLQSAVEQFRKALKINPRAADVLTSLGIALHDLKDLKNALTSYNTCLRHHPGDTQTLAQKSIALHELGETVQERTLVDLERFVQVRTINPPPGFASVAEFNQALVSFACSHPTLQADRISRTTQNGSQTVGGLLMDPQGLMQPFKTAIEQAVDDYMQTVDIPHDHPFRFRRPQNYRLACWATVLDSSGFHNTHIHPAGWLSGVYYAQIPDVISSSTMDGQKAGYLELGRPDGRYYEVEDYEVKTVKPEAGMMVLFPSYFWHRTLPFESAQARISFAFDVLPD